MQVEKPVYMRQAAAAVAKTPTAMQAKRMAKHPARHARRSNKKPIIVGVALSLAAVLALGRVLAWSDFTQSQVNRIPGTVDADVTLHDEFDGTNKDVFVENNGSNTLYVRVRLDEFMQIGDVKFDPNADPSEPTTWTPHTYTGTTISDCGNMNTPADDGEIYKFHDYYELVLSGEDRPYTPGTPGMVYTKLGTDDKVYPVDETREGHHTAAQNPPVLMTTFLHIKDIIDSGLTVSDADADALARIQTGCWVLDDTDTAQNGGGWAYWSAPLLGGTATNLLLDEVKLLTTPDADWIYLVDVKMQAVTANDFSKWNDAASTVGCKVTAGALELQDWWHPVGTPAPVAAADESVSALEAQSSSSLDEPVSSEEISSL